MRRHVPQKLITVKSPRADVSAHCQITCVDAAPRAPVGLAHAEVDGLSLGGLQTSSSLTDCSSRCGRVLPKSVGDRLAGQRLQKAHQIGLFACTEAEGTHQRILRAKVAGSATLIIELDDVRQGGKT